MEALPPMPVWGSNISMPQWLTAAGIHYKVRKLTLSAEGHVGKLDGNSETSAALGLRYDLARGLSLNFGYNYANTDADIDGIAIQSVDKSEFFGSVRYEF
jgi:hypothetical protein